MTVRVLVADDQPLFCSGMRLLLDAQPDLECVGVAHSGEQAVAEVARLRPDVVLMDLRMPGGSGLAATAAVQDRTRVLVLTTFRDQDAVAGAMRAGAGGFVTKDATPAELLRAVRDVAAGRPIAPSVGARPMLPDPAPTRGPNTAAITALTVREQEVFLHVARGLTNAEVARAASISENTVRKHVSAALQKLGLANRTQLAALAHREGLVGPG